jgi:hypothetical protein
MDEVLATTNRIRDKGSGRKMEKMSRKLKGLNPELEEAVVKITHRSNERPCCKPD